MDTLHQFSHQGILSVQAFVAVLVMLGLGLEGLSAGQDTGSELHDPSQGERS
ncbi:MAG: hypothetical protein IPM27_08645 [Nitrosomonadales bacterium]|nr:hypothetical protein [Nitrosomonadales bacterium]